MLFVFLFVLGGLVVPLVLDIGKHGSDHILRRAGRDLMNYPRIQSILSSAHIVPSGTGTAALGLMSTFVLTGVILLLVRAIVVVAFYVFELAGW